MNISDLDLNESPLFKKQSERLNSGKKLKILRETFNIDLSSNVQSPTSIPILSKKLSFLDTSKSLLNKNYFKTLAEDFNNNGTSIKNFMLLLSRDSIFVLPSLLAILILSNIMYKIYGEEKGINEIYQFIIFISVYFLFIFLFVFRYNYFVA